MYIHMKHHVLTYIASYAVRKQYNWLQSRRVYVQAIKQNMYKGSIDATIHHDIHM